MQKVSARASVGLLVAISWLCCSITVQAADKLPNQWINPDLPYYPIKRLWENIEAKFMFSHSQQVRYHQQLLKIRLAELSKMSDQHEIGQLQTSAQRVAYETGILVDQTKKLNDPQRTSQVMSELNQDLELLAPMRDKFESNSAYWIFVQQDIDTIKLLLPKLSQ